MWEKQAVETNSLSVEHITLSITEAKEYNKLMPLVALKSEAC